MIDFQILEAVPRAWFDFKSDILTFMRNASISDKNVLLADFVRDIKLDIRKRIQNVWVNLEDKGPNRAADIGLEQEACMDLQKGFPEMRTVLVSFRAPLFDDRWILCADFALLKPYFHFLIT